MVEITFLRFIGGGTESLFIKQRAKYLRESIAFATHYYMILSGAG